MTLPTFIAFGMATAFALGIAAAAVSRRLDVRARSAPRQRGAEPVTESDQRVVFHGGLPTDHVLVPAPLVHDPAHPEPFTLRDWLVHFTPHRDNAWPHVVERFYAEAAQMRSIASFFAGWTWRRCSGTSPRC